MSSRSGQPRERSWERGDRDRRDRGSYSRGGGGGGGGGGDRSRRRDSRSRSRSPRRGDRDKRDRRDYGRDRTDRHEPRRDDVRDSGRDGRDDRRDGRRDGHGYDRGRDHGSERMPSRNEPERRREAPRQVNPPATDARRAHPVTGSEKPADASEEGEEMEGGMEDENAAMMAMMGMGGFGTTKGKAVEGNQDGAVDIKKPRTWRQYMNRRGGFNRPLDKIK